LGSGVRNGGVARKGERGCYARHQEYREVEYHHQLRAAKTTGEGTRTYIPRLSRRSSVELFAALDMVVVSS